MGDRARHRCRERIEAISLGELDVDHARRGAVAELRRAIGFTRWCWPLTDPGSGLATSGIGEFDFAPSLPRLVALEEQGDVTSKPQLIVGARASAALSAATRGDLARSPRWRDCLHPYGIGDEVMTVCRDRYGCWGSVELMRDSDDRPFDAQDVRFLDELAPLLGALVRRSLLRDARRYELDLDVRPPGTIILDGNLSATGWTAPLNDWLDDLGGRTMLPPAVYGIGARVLTPPELAHRLPATVRVRTNHGRWCVIEGARLEGAAAARVAITIRPATADETIDLICRAHGLSTRERQLVNLALAGLATTELARALRISPYTVQDHLKAIFAKVGVRSRRELLSQLVPVASSRGIP
jgi:DNA-binding CsgD family transcriptional regulator